MHTMAHFGKDARLRDGEDKMNVTAGKITAVNKRSYNTCKSETRRSRKKAQIKCETDGDMKGGG